MENLSFYLFLNADSIVLARLDSNEWEETTQCFFSVHEHYFFSWQTVKAWIQKRDFGQNIIFFRNYFSFVRPFDNKCVHLRHEF